MTLTDAKGPAQDGRAAGGTAAATQDSDEARVAALCRQLLDELPPGSTDATSFLGRQFDLGLAWVHFPEGDGGLGLSPKLQKTINETLLGAGAPMAAGRNPIGHGMGAPTVATHGSEAQRRRYLRPLFTNEEIWCQLFSEPGAGSDVAGLSSRAVLDGDEWVLNGQKVWTTLAHVSRWGMIVVRTDPHQPKHKGLTYFVVDMHAPGVEVRPLYQITGEAEFNEVYFTDVRIPDSERLGEVGEGWRVSLTTLMNERVAIGGQIPRRGSGFVGELVKIWTDRFPVGSPERALKLEAMMTMWVRAEVLRLTNVRASQQRAQGTPGPEGIDRQAGHGRAAQGPDLAGGRAARPRRDAVPRRLPDGAARHHGPVAQPAAVVPALAGQLHRGRHHRDHEEHPGRAGARAAR
jgi:alkylation response protein AidB-like acyl-CoA dehydrogenase